LYDYFIREGHLALQCADESNSQSWNYKFCILQPFCTTFRIPTRKDDVYVSKLNVTVTDLYDDVIRYTCAVLNSLGKDEMNLLLVPRGEY